VAGAIEAWNNKRLAICNEDNISGFCPGWYNCAGLLIRGHDSLSPGQRCVNVSLADLGRGHCRRSSTHFAGLDRNLSRSLVLIGVLGKEG
jgi:hypothetical protein